MFWSCEPDEAQLGSAIDMLGPHAVVFASDYPHWDCTFPGAAEAVKKRPDLEGEAKVALLGDNARSLYRMRPTAVPTTSTIGRPGRQLAPWPRPGCRMSHDGHGCRDGPSPGWVARGSLRLEPVLRCRLPRLVEHRSVGQLELADRERQGIPEAPVDADERARQDGQPAVDEGADARHRESRRCGGPSRDRPSSKAVVKLGELVAASGELIDSPGLSRAAPGHPGFDRVALPHVAELALHDATIAGNPRPVRDARGILDEVLPRLATG